MGSGKWHPGFSGYFSGYFVSILKGTVFFIALTYGMFLFFMYFRDVLSSGKPKGRVGESDIYRRRLLAFVFRISKLRNF